MCFSPSSFIVDGLKPRVTRRRAQAYAYSTERKPDPASAEDCGSDLLAQAAVYGNGHGAVLFWLWIVIDGGQGPPVN